MTTDVTITASKYILKSKTVVGVLIASVPAVLALFGKTLNVDDVTALGTAIQGVLGHLDGIVQLGGSLLAIYGRFTASSKLHV